MNNEELYDVAMKAISELFGDKSVSRSTCRENLEGLISEIEIMIESLGETEMTNESDEEQD